jgi:hypothetical protein
VLKQVLTRDEAADRRLTRLEVVVNNWQQLQIHEPKEVQHPGYPIASHHEERRLHHVSAHIDKLVRVLAAHFIDLLPCDVLFSVASETEVPPLEVSGRFWGRRNMLENIYLGLFVELGLERDLARTVRVLDAALMFHLTVFAVEIVGAIRIVRPLIPLL